MNWRFIPVIGMLVLLPLPSEADVTPHEKCASEFEACLTDCDTRYLNDAGGKAACVPQCSGRYAACDAGVAYDEAKPWLEDQAKKTKKFFEDLMENLKKGPPAEPAPNDKSI